MSPCSGCCGMNVGNVNGNQHSEEEDDSRIMSDSGENILSSDLCQQLPNLKSKINKGLLTAMPTVLDCRSRF